MKADIDKLQREAEAMGRQAERDPRYRRYSFRVILQRGGEQRMETNTNNPIKKGTKSK